MNTVDQSFDRDARWFRIPGLNGNREDTLYDIARKNGFDGTIEDWNKYLAVQGGPGTLDYNELQNIPTVNHVALIGNLDLRQFGIPNKISELEQDIDYIKTSSVNLENYYNKNELYTKDEIAQIIGREKKLSSKIVEELPSIPGEDVIYLIKSDEDFYIQWMFLDGEWANIGSTQLNVEGLVTLEDFDQFKSEVTSMILRKVEKQDGKVLSSNDFTTQYRNKVDMLSDFDIKLKEENEALKEEIEKLNIIIDNINGVAVI